MTPAQYNQCVKDHADGIFRFVLKSIKDRDEAKNIVQNTFEKVWVRIDSVIYEKAKSYLFTIAYREMIDHIRYTKKFMSTEQMEEPVYKQDTYTGTKEILDKLVNKLPENQKSAILLRDYEGHDYKTISEITGMTEAQVKVNIFRARQFLKECIGKIETLI
ncbi:MAG: RNA polymerase sigma factor [Flavobacteriales bacterium]|nr:RNA polymerase sigma factor [Flavobacteriales bacterium]